VHRSRGLNNPYEFEPKVTPRPPGAGIFLVCSMEELRADVVRNGLGVIEGGRMVTPPA
jgi:hypothetical protein